MSIQSVVAVLRERATKELLKKLHAHAYRCAEGDATAFRHVEYEHDRDAEARLRHKWGKAVEDGELSEFYCYWFREAFTNIVMGREDEQWRLVEIDDTHEVSVPEVYRTVASRFPKPAILHADDLRDAFAKHMMAPLDKFEAAYGLFIGAVEVSFKERAIDVMTPDRDECWFAGNLVHLMRYARVAAGMCDAPVVRELVEPETLWQGDNGFELKLLAHDETHRWNTEGLSPLAIKLLGPAKPLYRYTLQLSLKAADHASNALGQEFGLLLNALLKVLSEMHGLRPSGRLLSAERDVVAASLDAYCAAPSTRDTIQRRIGNAVTLNTEADLLPHDGLALAICMSAIEALLGKKGSDISRIMAENIATLLEPDSRERPNAVRFVKKLYDERSRVLHGEKVTGERELRDQTRVLFAAVLKAIVERSNFLRRIGANTETPDGLFAELSDSKFGAGQLAGVSESVGRRLWRPSPPDPAPSALSAE